MAMMAAKPLRLKDLLELDCDSCSAAGFRCYPRHLCVAVPLPAARHEAAEVHSVFGRSRSLRRSSMLSIRSLSRRLRGSFSWMRRDEEAVAAPVPAASIGCSSDSETTSESESSSSSAETKSESGCSSACSAESLHAAGVTTTTDDGQEHEAMKEAGTGSGSESDDKEQLSPVAVMDFPFHDDEDDDVVEDGGTSDGGSASSPPFGDSLAQLHQRRNIQLKHKIRRCRSIREVPAVDLGERFAASECDGLASPDTDVAEAPSRLEGHPRRSVDVCQYPDEEENFSALLLTRTFSAVDASERRLLLDFFAETRELNTTENCEAAVKLAEDWMQGTGARWGLKEVLCGREDLVAEIDRGQRWSAHDGEEIGVLVAGLVIDELVRELVNDLIM